MTDLDPYTQGPYGIVVNLSNAWPMSNWGRGCKHDIWTVDNERFESGFAIPCAKCGVIMLHPDAVKRLYKEIDDFETVHELDDA